MKVKTYKIRRRLTVIGLTASIAAVAVPAATARMWEGGGSVGVGTRAEIALQSTAQEHGAPGFGNQPLDRQVLQNAAQEHGAAGFGNYR